MKKTFLASFAIASTIMTVVPAFAFDVVSFDNKTNTYERVQDGTILPVLKKVYTNLQNGEFYQQSHDAALSILKNQYSAAVQCAKKIDLSKCRQPMQW
jgi:hypothetical protein